MMIMMMMMILMGCFCSTVDLRITLTFTASQDHCQRSSSSQISNTPQAGFEPLQNLSSGFVERSCAVVITITLQHHKSLKAHILGIFLFVI